MADLLLPELLLVDGRTYRALYMPGGAAHQRRRRSFEDEQHEMAEEEWDTSGTGAGGGGGWQEDEPEEEPSVDIRQEGDGFVARLQLDSELYPHLIGQGGRTRKRIEDDTAARIAFPSRSAQQQGGAGGSGPVVVRGASRAAVARACTQLELLVSQQLSARGPKSLDYNYFLCQPLASPDTIAGFEGFRDQVLADPGAATAGLEPSVFMAPQHLHLTIAMLKLYSEERRELARRTLHLLAPRLQELLAGLPLEFQLKGLEYMNDDPSEMHVMYLGVRDAPGSPGSLQRLQQLCAAVVEAFGQAGLLLPQDDRPTKLHATVINTRYRKRGSTGGRQDRPAAGGGQQQEPRQPFDGRGLLERHGGVDLGLVRLPAVHLSQRGRYDQQTGFYWCADSLPLLNGA